MKRSFLMIVILLIIFIVNPVLARNEGNPFFSEYDTPFQVPPFEKIKIEHYLPAFKEGFKQQQENVKAIVSNPEEPAFENTIEALEKSGQFLTKVSDVFYNMLGANTNASLQKIAKEVAPLSSKNRDDIMLNEKLFRRVKAVYKNKDKLKLTVEQNTLLMKYYRDFIRGGANLSATDKDKLREINKELSLLSLKFGENVLAENNTFKLVIDKKEDLAGLSQMAIDGAAEAAKEHGEDGKWVCGS